MIRYSTGLRIFRWLFWVPIISGAITAIARIWSRHLRWRSHLRTFQFDGVIDGGANIGEFSQVVRDVLPNAHLLCIEPNPACAAYLRKQGYEVIQAALWNEKTTLNLFQDGPSTTGTVINAGLGDHATKVVAIRLRDLDIRGERLLIKLDLQGAEPFALEALGDLEKRCAGFLVEVSLPPHGTYESLNHFFISKGYVQFASVNELFSDVHQVEADILWIKKAILSPNQVDSGD